ncbi:MAG: ATP-binding cassette domain-containing protein [Rhodospirillales bacterium]|nr:ATP-binding cassette domain-containing protein [Rhodospirillales bacterium]
MGEARPVIEVVGLKKYFPLPRRYPGQPVSRVHAVDGVSFTIGRGETLALVGESGCGKSTVGRTILGLLKPTAGEVRLDGERIDSLSAGRLRPLRRRMQVVFQDPFSSLNPRLRVREILAEPLANFSLARTRGEFSARIAGLLEKVRLPADAAARFPHEFSGGQRQRIGIARALATAPEVIICDEAVSALDVSVKAQIVNLLADLQDELGLSLLFITHDLAIVEHLTHRVAVMYLGRIVEEADRRSLFARPWHPYTQALLSAVPVPDPAASRRRTILKGDVPSPIALPTGCRFHTRCPHAFARCRTEEPELRPVGDTQRVACHLEVRPGE